MYFLCRFYSNTFCRGFRYYNYTNNLAKSIFVFIWIIKQSLSIVVANTSMNKTICYLIFTFLFSWCIWFPLKNRIIILLLTILCKSLAPAFYIHRINYLNLSIIFFYILFCKFKFIWYNGSFFFYHQWKYTRTLHKLFFLSILIFFLFFILM